MKNPDRKVRRVLSEIEKDRHLTAHRFGFPSDTSWEEMRPAIARQYGLPTNATWEDIRAHRTSIGELDPNYTDTQRRRYARALGLSVDASWPAIRSTVESLRNYPT